MILRMALATILVALTLSEGAQAAGYVWPVNGHLYEAVPAPGGITWTEANNAATAVGGYLVTITSADESAFVFDVVLNDDAYWAPFGTHTHGPWIGGYQPAGSPEPDGGWQWVSGESWAYTNWASGEPNNYGGTEHWLQLWSPSPTRAPTWNDNTDGGPKPVAYVVEFNGPVRTAESTWGRIKALYRTR